LLDEIEAVLQRRQHAETEQVEFHQTGGRTVVLVPLQHGAVGHAAPLHRAHLDHRTVADHHATGMDAEVPRRVLQLLGQHQHLLGNRIDVTGISQLGLGAVQLGNAAVSAVLTGIVRAGIVRAGIVGCPWW
jgi:hypothetical protein